MRTCAKHTFGPENGELWLQNSHISHYSHGNIYNHDPLRSRKLLVHKHQVAHLIGKSRERE